MIVVVFQQLDQDLQRQPQNKDFCYKFIEYYMQERSQIALPVIAVVPSESRAKAMLSPFTWTNLTLPVVPKQQQSLQIKSKAQINQVPLSTIKQVETKNDGNKKSDANKQSLKKQTSKNNHHENNEFHKKPTRIDRGHRYSTNSIEEMNILNKTMQLKGRDQTITRPGRSIEKIRDPLSKAIQLFEQKQRRERETKSREQMIQLTKKESIPKSKSKSKSKQIRNLTANNQDSALPVTKHTQNEANCDQKNSRIKNQRYAANSLNNTMSIIKQKQYKQKVPMKSKEEGFYPIHKIEAIKHKQIFRAKSLKNRDQDQSFNKTLQLLSDEPKTKNLVLNNKEQKIRHLNKTIEVLKQQSKVLKGKEEAIQSLQTVKQNEKKLRTFSQREPGVEFSKRIRYLDQKNNMEKYLKSNLVRNGWKPSSLQDDKNAQLVWSNYDRPGDYQQLKKGQFYNHINGSVSLTNKDKLHEQLQARGCNYYPRSFLVPQQYEAFLVENNNIAVKMMLRTISLQLLAYFQKQNLKDEIWREMQIHLGQILESSILRTGNQTVNMLVKMCLYLQELRICEGYCTYFQCFKGYFKINIKPKANLYDLLMVQATQYLDNITSKQLTIDYKQIDYRLIALILHYHTIFQQNEPNYDLSHQLWIIKPIASSRGAGISIVRSSSSFCRSEGNLWSEFKNRKKYQNKIIQRYIANPFILTSHQQFSNRKFDIRQWVLVVSDCQIPKVYRYHTGYCRFAYQRFTLSKLSLKSHLTNYSLFKSQEGEIESVMMLQELFAECKTDLRSKYVQQSTQIIKDTIFNSRSLRYQQGCFELFGFDFLVDSLGKLYLLQINLNPGCSSERHEGLKLQSEIMGKTMIQLVTQKKQSDKWIAVEGPGHQNQDKNEFEQYKEINIRPFYQTTLDEGQSLIALIRHRKRVLYRLVVLTKRYLGRLILSKLKGTELQMKKQAKQRSQCQIRFVEQKSTSSF